jgi:hypothetical protein
MFPNIPPAKGKSGPPIDLMRSKQGGVKWCASRRNALSLRMPLSSMLRFPRIKEVEAFPKRNVGVGDCVHPNQADGSQFAGRLMASPHDLSCRARLWWYGGMITSALSACSAYHYPSHVPCPGRREMWRLVRKNLG